jgi:uncharacterized phosphosugar-binding protein
MSGSTPSAGRRYLRAAEALVARLVDEEWPRLDAAAELIAGSLAAGGELHAFGSGHSHMLAEEFYHRAGGLVHVRPILFDGLMLHGSTGLSTALERLPGLAAALRDDHPMAAGDVLVLASNSGGNAVVTELARLARDGGVRTVAVTNLRHATSAAGRDAGGPRLHQLVDVAIDTGGEVGDAAVAIDGVPTRVGPTSTVVGATIVNALVAEVVERLVAKGIVPEVFASSNVAGGDAFNERQLQGRSR